MACSSGNAEFNGFSSAEGVTEAQWKAFTIEEEFSQKKLPRPPSPTDSKQKTVSEMADRGRQYTSLEHQQNLQRSLDAAMISIYLRHLKNSTTPNEEDLERIGHACWELVGVKLRHAEKTCSNVGPVCDKRNVKEDIQWAKLNVILGFPNEGRYHCEKQALSDDTPRLSASQPPRSRVRPIRTETLIIRNFKNSETRKVIRPRSLYSK